MRGVRGLEGQRGPVSVAWRAEPRAKNSPDPRPQAHCTSPGFLERDTHGDWAGGGGYKKEGTGPPERGLGSRNWKGRWEKPGCTPVEVTIKGSGAEVRGTDPARGPTSPPPLLVVTRH